MCMERKGEHMWRSENIIQASVILFYHVGAKDQTQVLWFGSKVFTH